MSLTSESIFLLNREGTFGVPSTSSTVLLAFSLLALSLLLAFFSLLLSFLLLLPHGIVDDRSYMILGLSASETLPGVFEPEERAIISPYTNKH